MSIDHVTDALIARIEDDRAPVCVGLDPVVERLPRGLRPPGGDEASASAAIGDFCGSVLDAVAMHVPCVKLQSACFERYRAEGVAVLFDVMRAARARGMTVILDAKRGDIGISAAHYAAGAFDAGGGPADWITVNAYLGADGVEPFLERGGGAFALVRTSNPGGDALQSARLSDGTSVARLVASQVAQLGEASVGARGFSRLGAVVGATKRGEAAELRDAMPHQVILVPGYGAQGGGVDDVLPCFRADGLGAVVTASRSVIYAFEEGDPNWTHAVSDAAAALAETIGRAVGLRS